MCKQLVLSENEIGKHKIKMSSNFIFKNLYIYFIYLFLDRGGGRKKERERNINVLLPLKHPLLPQPRLVP